MVTFIRSMVKENAAVRWIDMKLRVSPMFKFFVILILLKQRRGIVYKYHLTAGVLKHDDSWYFIDECGAEFLSWHGFSL